MSVNLIELYRFFQALTHHLICFGSQSVHLTYYAEKYQYNFDRKIKEIISIFEIHHLQSLTELLED